MTTITAKQAISKGYAIISKRYRLVARIDRSDWREYMAANHPNGIKWVEALGNAAGDHYRRCYSKDVIVIPQNWMKMFRNSGEGLGVFVE
jgi:hypothetical protein